MRERKKCETRKEKNSEKEILKNPLTLSSFRASNAWRECYAFLNEIHTKTERRWCFVRLCAASPSWINSIHEQLFIYEVHHMRELYATTARKSAALHETSSSYISLPSHKNIYIPPYLIRSTRIQRFLNGFIFRWYFDICTNDYHGFGTQQQFRLPRRSVSKRQENGLIWAAISYVAKISSIFQASI